MTKEIEEAKEILRALDLCIVSLNAKICFSPLNIEDLKQRYEECKQVRQILSNALETKTN